MSKSVFSRSDVVATWASTAANVRLGEFGYTRARSAADVLLQVGGSTRTRSAADTTSCLLQLLKVQLFVGGFGILGVCH